MKFVEFTGKKRYDSFIKELSDFGGDKIVINPDGEKCVCFMAGLHGDEVAGPLGILEFLKEKVYVPKNCKVVIFPLVNHSGFKKNTRENGDGIDINRHFLDDELTGECKQIWDAMKDENIELLHTLHEDPDMKSFYLYYTHTKDLAEEIRELAKKHFEIYGGNKRKPLNGELYSDKVFDGLIPLPHTVRGTIEDRVLANGTPYITTETPGKASLNKRVEFTKDVIKLVIRNFA